MFFSLLTTVQDFCPDSRDFYFCDFFPHLGESLLKLACMYYSIRAYFAIDEISICVLKVPGTNIAFIFFGMCLILETGLYIA